MLLGLLPQNIKSISVERAKLFSFQLEIENIEIQFLPRVRVNVKHILKHSHQTF